MTGLPITRRHWLQTLAGSAIGLLAPWSHANHAVPASDSPLLLAAWQADTTHAVGLIRPQSDGWTVQAQRELPGRPHGLHALPDGSVLVVARRPGDWLLRWHPATDTSQWHWEQGDQRFNGHLLNAPHDPDLFFSSETDQDSGAGLIGVRRLDTLARQASWPTHGLDPHQLLLLPEALGPWPAGTLLVANGGIPTQAESGRSKKHLGAMDPSLVALDPRSGTLLGQWRLSDPRLSVRHLAWNPQSRQVGVALQAEHDDPAQRLAAPVFARWNGQTLQASPEQPVLQGYGGSVCALPDGGFCVSCPRAGGVAWFDATARFLALQTLPQACPLAWLGGSDGQLWAGGNARIATTHDAATTTTLATPDAASGWQFDNHWLFMPPTQTTG